MFVITVGIYIYLYIKNKIGANKRPVSLCAVNDHLVVTGDFVFVTKLRGLMLSHPEQEGIQIHFYIQCGKYRV